MLWKQPVITLIVALTLSLGIGANGVIFSLVNALLLRPLPAEKPSELAAVYTSDFSSGDFGASSYPDYVDFRDRNRVFTGLVAYQPPQPLSLNIDGTNGACSARSSAGIIFQRSVSNRRSGAAFCRKKIGRPASALSP